MSDIWISLGFAGVFFGAMAFRGIFGYLKNDKISEEGIRFEWGKFFKGSIRPVLTTLAVGALVALVLGFLRIVNDSNIQVSGLEQITPQTIEIGLAIADIGAIGLAIKEMLVCFGLSDKEIEQIRETVANTEDGQTTGVQIGLKDGDLVAYANAITPTQIKEVKPTDDGALKLAQDLEDGLVGLGAGANPLTRRLPDGDTDNGKGWQCSKYSYYLATGIRMDYAPHPDYGPCNGNAMVDYLVNNCGYVRCGKINGAIFSYNTGDYGHTGMVLDANSNTVNDANWQPLAVGTHYINLEAVGAWYCCPPEMLEPTPTPTPTPTPDPSPSYKPVTDDVVDAVIRGDYGNYPERKERLEAEGYNYDEVQAAVNARYENNTPAPEQFSVGDEVVPIELVDYYGVPLYQWDPSYTITEINGDRAVLSARGQVWAAMNTNNIRKA